MKVIVIAAGRGSRLKHLTEDTPKCLLEVNGKSILQHQCDTFRRLEINDISIVKGYKKEKILFPGVKYYINDNYVHNDGLHSLMYAEKEMDSEFIVSFSDILFHDHIVKNLIQSPEDISLVVDTEWKNNYIGRKDHPLSEAANVLYNKEGYVIKIAKNLSEKDSPFMGEFIGMMKCTQKGAQIFKTFFYKAKNEFTGKPFMSAKNFDKAYIEDLCQYMVNQGIKIKCTLVKGGWQEIDTQEDIERVREKLRKGWQ